MKSSEQRFVRLKLVLAYDGRPFCGWQRQTNDASVQANIERALAQISGRPVIAHGAGRTDAGVHALGQVAHADVRKGQLAVAKWQAALNGNLPAEIRVVRIAKARPDFHSRFDAKGKVYLYRIWNDPFLHPLEIGRAWHLPRELDLPKMKSAARLLEGTHDFSAFTANRAKPERNRVRTIFSIEAARRGRLITLRFHGTGFLYKMVRMLTGSIARCGEGRADLDWLEGLLAPETSQKTQFVAPAEGLYLANVLY